MTAEPLVTIDLPTDAERNGNGAAPDERSTNWRPRSWSELEALLITAAEGPRRPEIGGLLTPRSLTSINGEAGVGKTRLAASIVADGLERGHKMGWWDTEQGDVRVVRQIQEHGASDQAIIEHLILVTSPIGLANDEQLETLAKCRVIILDGITGALAALGLNSNHDIDVERLYSFLRRLAAMGPAVGAIDHPVKNKQEQGRYASGSQRKLAAVDSALRIDVRKPLRPDQGGHLKITIAKDRDGVLSPCEWILEPDMSWRIESTEIGAGETWKPTFQMQRISEYLEAQDEPVSKDNIEKNVKGENDKVKREAIAHLIADEYVAVEKGKHGAHLHTSIRPYREHLAPISASSANLVYSSANRATPITSATSVTPTRGNEEAAEVEDDHLDQYEPVTPEELYGLANDPNGEAVPAPEPAP